MKGPYIGPRPFEWDDKEDAARYFGREIEAEELRFRIHASPVLLLYAQSGAGKTSLLNAKLIPQLSKDGFSVLPPLRFKSFTRPDEKEVKGRVLRAITSNDPVDANNQNPYLKQITDSWQRLLAERAEIASKIPNFLRVRLNDEIPPSTLSKLILDPSEQTSEQAQIVVVFDQFEELLAGGRTDLNLSFFGQIAECVEKSTSIRFVFSVRSEWLALFDKYAARIPTAVRSRFYLEQLDSKAAEEAIIEPAKLFKWTFEQEAATSLVRKLREVRREVAPHKFEAEIGEFVEPVQLQIVCQDIWKRLQQKPSAEKKITKDDVGNVSDPLGNYYTEAVIHTAKETGLAEGRIREWIARNLITEARTRGSVFKGEAKAGGIKNRVPEKLEEARLVRTERRNGSWYELVHDSFINPILESNDNWRTQLSGAAKFAEELRERAVRRGRLLSAAELQEAQTIRAASKARAEDDEVDLLVDELIEKSEAELKREAEVREAELKRQTEAREAELKREADAREAELKRDANAREAELKRQAVASETERKRQAEESARQQAAQRKIWFWTRIAFATVCVFLLVSWLQIKGRSDLESKHVAWETAKDLGDAREIIQRLDPKAPTNAPLLAAVDGVAWCFQAKICPPIKTVSAMNKAAEGVAQFLEGQSRTDESIDVEIPFLPSPYRDVMVSVEHENTPVVWDTWTFKPLRLSELPSKITAIGLAKDFDRIAVSDANNRVWFAKLPKRRTGVIGYVLNFFRSLKAPEKWSEVVPAKSLEELLELKGVDAKDTESLRAAHLLRSRTGTPLQNYEKLTKTWFLNAAGKINRSYTPSERRSYALGEKVKTFSDRVLEAFAADRADPTRARSMFEQIVSDFHLPSFDSGRLMALLYVTHARLNVLNSQFDLAIADYNRAAEIDPTLDVQKKARALHLFKEANGLASSGSREAAKAKYEEAIREDKSLKITIVDPAKASEKNDNDLTSEVQKVLEAANTLAIQGKSEEARKKYEEAKTMAPKTLARLVPREEIEKLAPKGPSDTPPPSPSATP